MNITLQPHTSLVKGGQTLRVSDKSKMKQT